MDSGIRPAREVERRMQAFEVLCRRRGIRVTSQRLEVYRAAALDARHPNVDSIYARVHASMPAVSLATVYRTLDFLETEGLIRRVSTTDCVSRYDGNLNPHQHLVCRVCGRIMDLEAPPLIDVGLATALPSGFQAEALDLRIVGVCGECSTKTVRRRPASAS